MKNYRDEKRREDTLTALDLSCNGDHCDYVWLDLSSWSFAFIGNWGSAVQTTTGALFAKKKIVVRGRYREEFPFRIAVDRKTQVVTVERERQYPKSEMFPNGAVFREEGTFRCSDW